MVIDFDKLKLGIVTLTVGHWDLMPEHFDSINKSYPHPHDIYIVPNLLYQRSVSAAVNLGVRRAIDEGCDYICYAADDVIVGKEDIESLLNKLIEDDLWVCHHHTEKESGYFFWVANPDLFTKANIWWDEFFYPAYFEDNDWERRIKLVDASKVGYINTDCTHIGSVTKKRLSPLMAQQHHKDFERNRARYALKWGGLPGTEEYDVAWNGGDPIEV